MVWKGFNFGEEHSYEDNIEELSIKWKYVDKKEVTNMFMDIAKSLGSEEQLETFLSEFYDTCYFIGYQEALVHDIENKINDLITLDDLFEKEE